MELSTHKELSEAFAKIEQYLVRRSISVHQNGKQGFNMSQVQFIKKPTQPFTENPLSPRNSRMQEFNNKQVTQQKASSLARFFQNLGLSNSKNEDENGSSQNISGRKSKSAGVSLLSIPHGSAPLAKTAGDLNKQKTLKLPLESAFLDYSREYFQEPQMRKLESDELGSVEYSTRVWRRNRNETVIQETQSQKRLALYGDWSSKKVCLDNKTHPKVIKFTQFESYLVSADERDDITVYDWEEKSTLSRFSNGNPFGTKVTDLKFLNEDDALLLMAGSSEGIIKIYKNIDSLNDIEMISSWRGLTDMLLTPRSSGL